MQGQAQPQTKRAAMGEEWVMTCGGQVARVSDGVKAMQGVVQIVASHDQRLVWVALGCSV